MVSSRGKRAGATAALLVAVWLSAGSAFAACPGPEGFPAWLESFKQDAASQGISAEAIAALDGVQYDQSVINADRRQGVFSQSFLEFSDRMVAQYRMTQGRKLLSKYKDTFDRIEHEYGVPGPVIVGVLGPGDGFRRQSRQDTDAAGARDARL